MNTEDRAVTVINVRPSWSFLAELGCEYPSQFLMAKMLGYVKNALADSEPMTYRQPAMHQSLAHAKSLIRGLPTDEASKQGMLFAEPRTQRIPTVSRVGLHRPDGKLRGFTELLRLRNELPFPRRAGF